MTVRCHLVLAGANRARLWIVPPALSPPALPLILISRLTRHSPTSRRTSLSSIVVRGRPLRLPAGRALRVNCAAKAQAILFPDMRQYLQIRSIPTTHGPGAPRTITTSDYPHHAADRFHRPHSTPALHAKFPLARTSRPRTREELGSLF
jgi:hypothetical protein